MSAFFTDTWWCEKSRHSTAIILCLVTMLFVAAILLSAHGVRGTDQYWYLADVTTLIEGSKPLSNLYFPRALIESRDHANFFIHNGPALYLSAMFGTVVGAFSGWLTLNILSHLLTALCIYAAARRYTSYSIAVTSCFLYMISPIAVWQSVNMMQECFFAALLAVVITLYAYRKRKITGYLLPVTLSLCVAVHPLFTALALYYLLVNLSVAISCRKHTQVAGLLLFSVVCVAIYKLYPVIFPTTFQPDLRSIIAGSIPKVSSMLWHYSDTLPVIDRQLIQYKLIYALKVHLTQLHFYFYTNLALLSTVFLVFGKRRQLSSTVYFLAFIMLLYVALSVLMQTQPRYQQIFAPAIFLLIAITLHNIKKYIPTPVKNLTLVCFTSASVVIGAYLCFTVSSQAKEEQQSLMELRNHLAAIPIDSRVLLKDSQHETKLSYLLRPRKLLSIKTDLLEPASYVAALSRFQPDFVISTQAQPQLPTSLSTKGHISTSYLGNFFLYHLDNIITADSAEIRDTTSQIVINQRGQR